MGSFSIWHWLIVALVILVLFGRGRISEMMGDFGKGISSFKKGMAEEDKKPDEPAKQIPPPSAAAPAAPPVADPVVAPPPAKDDTAI